MARFRASFGRILTIGGLAAATSTAAVYHSHLVEKTGTNSKNLETAFAVDDSLKPPRTKWDSDWDRRSNFYELAKAIRRNNIEANDDNVSKNNIDKNGETMCNNGDENEELKKRPKATRHLIFVRHGQYFSGKKPDEEKTLTDLGRFAIFFAKFCALYIVFFRNFGLLM